MTRPAPIIAGTLAVLLLLFGAYVGSYYAMLDYDRMTLVMTSGPLEIVGSIEPIYRMEAESTTTLFYPAHCIDRLIRPSYWGDE